ncbi:MAG TPA: PEP-CTERM sorting domain-containing protein, partial [Burkholderiaceae bacterium]
QGNETDHSGACDAVGLTGCDTRMNNSSSFGDLSGSTAVFDQIEWINGVVGAVPEPTESALLLAGLGVIGLVVRRRRAV